MALHPLFEFRSVDFLEGRKLENQKKTLRAGTRTNNKLNPHTLYVMPGPRIEPGLQWWEVNALTTASFLLALNAL